MIKWISASALAATVMVAALMMGSTTDVGGQTAPSLGAADSYAVLGSSTVTNTGLTVIDGDVGVYPGTSVTGFPPGTVNPPGTIHSADANALQAQSDVTTAYNDLAGQTPCTSLTDQDLGGMTLTEGVYCFSSSAQLTGTLTLDAQGTADAVFIFQIGSTLTTASNSSVLVTNGGVGCNVFWQVGSSATIGTYTTFVGNILALTSITLDTGASVSGRALASTGAVTMDTNTINRLGCAAPAATYTPTSTSAPTRISTATATPIATGTVMPVSSTSTPSPAPTATGTVMPVSATSTPSPAPTATLAPTVTPIPWTPLPLPTNVPSAPSVFTPTPGATATAGATPTPSINTGTGGYLEE